jgi:hypothetical protein
MGTVNGQKMGKKIGVSRAMQVWWEGWTDLDQWSNKLEHRLQRSVDLLDAAGQPETGFQRPPRRASQLGQSNLLACGCSAASGGSTVAVGAIHRLGPGRRQAQVVEAAP